MIVSRIIDEKAFDGLKGRWLRSFAGDRFVYLFADGVDRYRRFESTGLYGTGEIRQMNSFDFREYLSFETVENAALRDELESDMRSAERWTETDRLEFLREHLSLLLARSERILENAGMYWSLPGVARAGTSFGGGRDLPIGPLLEAWREGELIVDCPRCGAHSLAVFQLGAGLSGGSESGICSFCGEHGCRQGFVKERIRTILARVRNARYEESRGLRFNAVVELLHAD